MYHREQSIEDSLHLVGELIDIVQLSADEKQQQQITPDELENDPTGVNGVLDFFMMDENAEKVEGFAHYVRGIPYNDNPNWKPDKIAERFGMNKDLLNRLESWIRQ